MSEILENVPLAPMTALRIGGAARRFAVAESEKQLASLLALAVQHEWPLLVLGGGSNVLVSDRGWPGLAVRIATRGLDVEERGGDVVVRVAAGEDWDALVATAVDRDWAGVECLSGIPGLVGATPIQNVGAYGQEVAESIVGVEVIDRRTLKTARFDAADCGFRYRDSRFKSDEPDRWIVRSVAFRLRRGGSPSIRYADLGRRFETSGNDSPSLSDVREAVIGIRRGKGMVIDSDDPDTRSAGSFFTNPIVSEDVTDTIRERIVARGGDPGALRAWPAEEGKLKLSAAWLIERSGFTKGSARGAVGISSKHALAIVNRGGATANDVAAFAAAIRSKVREEWGVDLVPEPRYVGPFD